jgi:hypothetical protein
MTTEMIPVTDADNPLVGLDPETMARIKAAAERLRSASSVTVRKVGIKQGGLRYRMPDNTEVKKFSGVIVAVKHANRLYTKPYVAGQPELADCAAVALGGGDNKNGDLFPLASCAGRFVPAGTNCGRCPNLQWESSKIGTGRGKACTEYTMAAVYIPSLGESLFLVEQKKARASRLDDHLNKITAKFGHPMAVYTEFSIAEDDQAFDQNFYATGFVPQELTARLVAKLDEAESLLVAAVENSLGEGPESAEVAVAEAPVEGSMSEEEAMAAAGKVGGSARGKK